MGLYPATHGAVQVNEHDLQSLDKSTWRNRLGLVAQEAQLFSGTIRENLRFVKPSASDEECRRVLQQAAILDIVEENQEGLDTKIGEGGLKLSGGQRQRLAIARALLREPDVLIFDEATSSLDSLVEQEITDTVKDISKAHPELITLLVAHRLSTVMHADRIYVLEKGKVIEVGSHKELLEQRGLYAAMWRQQVGE